MSSLDKVKSNEKHTFAKSDIGAQSAWIGFSSQTLYIASRIINDSDDYVFFPEDIEDLVIKKDGVIVETIQIKNISADLTFSSLAFTKSSKGGEGFFNRACSLHTQYPKFTKVRIVYFSSLGSELQMFVRGDSYTKDTLFRKLTTNHGLTNEYAEWLLSSLVFEKVDIEQLQASIERQLSDYVAVMAAPNLAKTLLIQYVSDLSKSKGHTTLKDWQEQMYKIGTDIAAMDGYYKEYQKSLVRLCDLHLAKDAEQLRVEFEQGISAQPDHIRNNLDLPREIWVTEIAEAIDKTNVAIVKGVSGQGKTALCYRYLLKNYPEQLVFCVRSITSVAQAENLAVALSGIAKHTDNMIVYIDVNSGELKWMLLLQELQARGLSVPVLVSIRDEDYNRTQTDGNIIQFKLVELGLSKLEAQGIYESYTSKSPHQHFRSFDEAWEQFGGNGPLIEFVYLLTNNQTLKQRLKGQIANLLCEKVPDSWFEILHLVCYTGRIGCPLELSYLRQETKCDNIYAAIKRLSDEYLIRTTDDGQYIEALHSLRAQIICDILRENIGENSTALMLASYKCIDSKYVQLFLMDFFSKHAYSPDVIQKIASTGCSNWISFAGVIKAMLWLDVKRYVEQNRNAIDILIKEKGSGWLTFMPLDVSGLIRPNEIPLESFASTLPNVKAKEVRAAVKKVKDSFTSLQIDYEATDLFILHCKVPSNIPIYDNEWSLFGYSLFWLKKRGLKVEIPFTQEILAEKMLSGDIQSKADAIRGIYEQNGLDGYYGIPVVILLKRIYTNFCIVNFYVSDNAVQCKFVPPLFNDAMNTQHIENFNHYWKIKLLNILQQMYSGKEYIEIELVGVDLLGDLGLGAIDHKICIHKNSRLDNWITEINAWEKSRIDYYYRPDSWQQYVSRVDVIRRFSHELVNDAIACFDNIYKKQRLDKIRWDKVVGRVNKLKELCFLDMLLPKSVVDPYCLYREDMKRTSTIQQQEEQFRPITQMLSYREYALFRKSFSDVYLQLGLFFNQITNILFVRINKKGLDGIDNPRLSLINLFNSAKALVKLEEEYLRLFKGYGILDDDFNKREMESFVTLLNMWEYISENQIKGYSIAYDAKQRYRKSSSTIDRALDKAISNIGGKLLTIENTAYLIVSFDPFSETTMGAEYTKVVLELRECCKSAIPFGSERWYLEMYDPKLVFVPIYKGIPLLSGFEIPMYKILDINEEPSMFPVELPPSLNEELHIRCEELALWKNAIACLDTARMLIKQYNDVVSRVEEKTACEMGICQYVSLFYSELSKVIDEFSNNISVPIDVLSKEPSEMAFELLGILSNLIDDWQTISDRIINCESIKDYEDNADNMVAVMLLLQPDIVTGTNNNQ